MKIKTFAFVLVAGLTGCASFHSTPPQNLSSQNVKSRIVHNHYGYLMQKQLQHKANDADDISIQNLMA
jgi:hypothetical protein